MAVTSQVQTVSGMRIVPAPQVHRSGDEVDSAHQRSAAENGDTEDPQVLSHALAGAVSGPAPLNGGYAVQIGDQLPP